MEVKEAVNIALVGVADLFEDQELSNLALEEVDYDAVKRQWLITVGFSRPWELNPPGGALAQLAGNSKTQRSYKIVKVDDNLRKVVSVKNWDKIPF